MTLLNEGAEQARMAVFNCPAALQAALALSRVGDVYVVGGVVRDAFLGINANDVDLLVCGASHACVDDALSALPGYRDYRGLSFGVFRYRTRGSSVDVSLPRREVSTGPRHADFAVQEDPFLPIEDDLARRDFTVNAMAVPMLREGLIDPFGGMNDAAERRLVIIGEQAMIDDPLRTVRGLVLHARFGLQPDPVTRGRMTSAADKVLSLPGERIYWELDKLFSAAHPAAGVRLGHELGILRYFLPEVDATFGYDQRNPHHELDLGAHLLAVLSRATLLTTDPDVRFAALLHDIGKPASAWVDPETGSHHYYEARGPNKEVLGADHAEVGAEMTRERLLALRWPLARIGRVVHLVRHHMFGEFTTAAGARRFVSAHRDLAEALLDLREADQGAGKDGAMTDVARCRTLIRSVRDAKPALSRTDLAVSGKDVLEAGVPAGPEVGRILGGLLSAVLEDPSLNERGTLLTMIDGLK